MLKTFEVTIDRGTTNTTTTMVKARSHEEAEKEALLATGIPYEEVVWTRMRIVPDKEVKEK